MPYCCGKREERKINTHYFSKTKIIPLRIQYVSKKDKNVTKELLYYGIHGHTEKNTLVQLTCTKENIVKNIQSYISGIPTCHHHIYHERVMLKQMKLIGDNPYSKELIKKIGYRSRGIWSHCNPGDFLTCNEMNKRLKYMCMVNPLVLQDIMIIPLSDPGVSIDPVYKEVNMIVKDISLFEQIKEINKRSTTLFMITLRSIIQKIGFFDSLLSFEDQDGFYEFVFNVYDKQTSCDAMNMILLHDFIPFHYNDDKIHCEDELHDYITRVVNGQYTNEIHRLFNMMTVLDFFCFHPNYVTYFKNKLFECVIKLPIDDVLYEAVQSHFPICMCDMYRKIHRIHEDTSPLMFRDNYVVFTYVFFENIFALYNYNIKRTGYANIHDITMIVSNTSNYSNVFNVYFIHYDKIYAICIARNDNQIKIKINVYLIDRITNKNSDEHIMTMILNHPNEYYFQWEYMFIPNELFISSIKCEILQCNTIHYSNQKNCCSLNVETHVNTPMSPNDLLLVQSHASKK